MPSDDYLLPPPYRDPSKLPQGQRIGLTISEPGKPFEHWCAVCGERAPWGFRQPQQPPDVLDCWYRMAHRADGEGWFLQ